MTDIFRSELKAWLQANAPVTMCTPMPPSEVVWGGSKGTFPHPDSAVWLEAMSGRGYTAPRWPVDYGGAGLDDEQAAVLAEELAAIGARAPLWSFGLWMLGPVLLEYGTEAQKRRFLPPIARGEVRWCQGYSEPGAGSDLASLRMRAEDRGDHWLINGQKVWTSYADEADWIFCLVRTEPEAGKHKGISFILVDMASPGVSVRPIELISGSSPFCETFFDDVVVPKENLVGKRGEGWTIAKKLLEYERQNVSAIGFGGDGTVTLPSLAFRRGLCSDDGRIKDPVLRDKVTRLMMDEQAVALLTQQAQAHADAGVPGFGTSIVKYASARLNQARDDLAMDLLGMDGAGWSGEDFEPEVLSMSRAWLRSKGNSIEGGTSEIQLNVLAKHALNLPGN